MALFDHLLLAADFSEPSRVALAGTLALAVSTGARRITVLYVAREVVAPEAGPDAARERLARLRVDLAEDARRALAAMLAELPPPACPLELVVAHGRPAQLVAEQAQALGATLLVLGTHARTGVRRWVMGSIAEAVLGGATVPALVAHTGADGRPPEVELARPTRVLVAVDPADEVDVPLRVALEAAAAMRPVRPTVTALSVLGPPRAAEQGQDDEGDATARRRALEARLRARVEGAVIALGDEAALAGLVVEARVEEGEAAATILTAASALGAELVVLGAGRGGRADAGALGATAVEVLRRSDVSVLMVPGAVPISHARPVGAP